MGTKNDPGAFDCYEHAEPDEPMFTLLARDVTAPATVEAWASYRETRLRATLEGDSDSVSGREVIHELDQIAEARRCAEQMRAWREANR